MTAMDRTSSLLFAYPTQPHMRKHGPFGYESYTTYKNWLRDEFQFRCVYCLERERWYPNGQSAFGIDHRLPKGLTQYQPLLCVYENLLYVCNECNSLKGNSVLLDPCVVALGEHVRVRDDGAIGWLSNEGKKFVEVLGLDSLERQARHRYMRLQAYLSDHLEDPTLLTIFRDYFGYPDDLPNLAILRPEGNSRPEGIVNCFYQQRLEGRLPATY